MSIPLQNGCSFHAFIHPPHGEWIFYFLTLLFWHDIVNQTITFNASSSYDPDGNVTSYEWDCGDGNITNTTEVVINYSYSSAGVYNLRLTITDDSNGTNTTNKTIRVIEETTPPAVTEASANPASIPDDTITIQYGVRHHS